MRTERRELLTNPFVIRFHHMVLWWDFASAYLNKMGQIPPWDLPENERTQAFNFAELFIGDDIKRWSYARDYLESNVEGPDEIKKLKYLYDLQGPTDETLQAASELRKGVYTNFLTIALADPNAKIQLTLDKDNYCDTCAIGKHCKRGLLATIFKNDRDYVFRKALGVFVKEGKFDGGLGKDGNGNFYITPKLLFDKNFFSSFWEQIRVNGDGDWI